VQVLRAGDDTALMALGPRFDMVLIDAPCTGTGTWRRKPDAKWRLKPKALADRQAEQSALLDQAAELVKPGGRLVYVTCSILPEENSNQVDAFLARRPDFKLLPFKDAWRDAIGTEPPAPAGQRDDVLTLTPHQHSTDGFFVALMTKAA
jgi:16S rRNA (cytosine967-C5)-methyltransferase